MKPQHCMVKVAAAQTPEFREDIGTALAYAIDVCARAEVAGASLICFPEGYLQGYLTDEATARASALEIESAAFHRVLDQLPKTGPAIVMGLIEAEAGRIFNTAVVIAHGKVIGRYRKAHLLDGEKIFDAGNESPVFQISGLSFGINICYDTNFPEAARRIADAGGSLIVCPANNMMRRSVAMTFKDVHNAVRGERCRETGLWLLSADVTGERDGRISWGPTAVLGPTGEVAAQLPLEEPGLLVFDIPCARNMADSENERL